MKPLAVPAFIRLSPSHLLNNSGNQVSCRRYERAIENLDCDKALQNRRALREKGKAACVWSQIGWSTDEKKGIA